MRTTQRELADMAGVSQNSVHRAIHGLPGLSDATRERILSLAAEHGYRLHTSARSMRGRRMYAHALVLPHGRGTFLPLGLALGATRACESLGLHLHLAQLPASRLADEGRVPKVLSELAVDGLLINHIVDVAPAMVDLISRYGIPSIWINSRQDRDSVRPDDPAAGREATRRLLSLGHRRIAFARFGPMGEDTHYSVEDRVAGYRVAMDEAGLRPMLVHCDFLAAYLRGSEEDERLATAEAALTSDERPTAVVCYEDDETAIIICAAYRLGLRVPEDLSVVTFAADPPETCGILVTTLQVPHWQVGEAAVAALETKVASPSTDLEPELLPFTYCEGSTVAKPPSDQP